MDVLFTSLGKGRMIIGPAYTFTTPALVSCKLLPVPVYQTRRTHDAKKCLYALRFLDPSLTHDKRTSFNVGKLAAITPVKLSVFPVGFFVQNDLAFFASREVGR